MLKSVTYAVTEKCNSRCTNCNIWKEASKEGDELTIEQAERLFSLKDFINLNHLGITGGEPFLRNDINDLLVTILKVNRNINTININTNASKPDEVLATCDSLSSMNVTIYIGVSIDGDRNTNKLVRGIDSYADAVHLIKSIKKIYPKIAVSVSFTVCKLNCDNNNLLHIKELGEELDCDYSFRVASSSKSFYKNEGMETSLTKSQKKTLIKFIIDNKLQNEFMKEQLYYLVTGKVPLLYDYYKDQTVCPAGNLFAFIHANGDIHPCLYSDEVIGNYKNGLFHSDNQIKKTRYCPCMTECNLIPIFHNIGYHKKQVIFNTYKQIKDRKGKYGK